MMRISLTEIEYERASYEQHQLIENYAIKMTEPHYSHVKNFTISHISGQFLSFWIEFDSMWPTTLDSEWI